MRYLFIIFSFSFFISTVKAQVPNHQELGIEIQAASISSHGGTLGGALKYAFVSNESFAWGPSLRFQYIWSKNQYLGTSGSKFTWGGGLFAHYRFFNWFFLGAEVEYLKNPYAGYTTINDKRKWTLTAMLGGGISKEFGPVRLNVGILYDVVDGLSDPHTTSPSPLSRDYFIKVSNPQSPNYGRYLPIIYRIALFIPLNKKKNTVTDDYDDY